MKKYLKPEFEVTMIDVRDVVTASLEHENEGGLPEVTIPFSIDEGTIYSDN